MTEKIESRISRESVPMTKRLLEEFERNKCPFCGRSKLNPVAICTCEIRSCWDDNYNINQECGDR